MGVVAGLNGSIISGLVKGLTSKESTGG